MDCRKLLTVMFTMIFIFACSAKKPEPPAAQTEEPAKSEQKEVRLPPPPPPVFGGELKKPDPLEGRYITVSAVEAPLSSILYMAAAESGMNLVISPEIDINRPVTLNLNRLPAREALNIITETAGIYFETDGNILRIRPLTAKTYKIPYVHTVTAYSSRLGGDIIGGAAESAGTMAGSYNLEFTNPGERNDLYRQITEGVRSIIFPGRNTDSGSDTKTAEFSPSGEGFSLNMFTGILTVQAGRGKIQLIDRYMDAVLKETSKQVLIEAKMVEVTLNDINSYGINWDNFFFNDQLRYRQNFATSSAAALENIGLTPVAAISYASGGANGLLNLISQQGKIETLGNPRIRVVNGQSAIISSGSLIPYWEKNVEDGEDLRRVVSYNRITILDGIMLGVTPYIHDDGTITLNIIPVSTMAEKDKVQLGEEGEIVASFPVLNLKEAGTVLNVRNGETVVLGGMIDNYEENTEQRVPFLGDLPIVGTLFKSVNKRKVKKELVIFIKTSVINI
ncbi:secretin and TonB N-terminal domain-containing protein [Geovibrio ferrireducens]|uniref:secretin and TonB N-terminal domain-containing protein n=1 Tax=Geovibrio ferrireducens TaxID=46201 RepID=UPI002245000E|nr:secretin and TonB N-terminal domain-containing protein [Geovibrio ferrireducens]